MRYLLLPIIFGMLTACGKKESCSANADSGSSDCEQSADSTETTDQAAAFTVASIQPPQTEFTLTITNKPADAIEMMASRDSSFADGSWVAVADSTTVPTPTDYSNCGANTFYLKFRDEAGVESETRSNQADLVCLKELSIESAPSARKNHSAVWTGEDMIVWGGVSYGSQGDFLSSGGIYNLATDTWKFFSTASARFSIPARAGHGAVWTGSEMIIWGGANDSVRCAGARYNPSSDRWTFLSSTNAPAPRDGLAAVWTGTEMIIFGGSDGQTFLANGYAYNPTTDTWRAISQTNAPAGRYQPQAVWTGSHMIVWGGTTSAGANLNDMFKYDPATDTWTQMPDVPSERLRREGRAVFDGNRIWSFDGLSVGNQYLQDFDSFRISDLSWADAPSALSSANTAASGVWADGKIITFGGDAHDSTGSSSNKGTIYYIFN